MKTIEFTEFTEAAQHFDEGQIVEHNDEGLGIIVAVLTEPTEWFPDPNDDSKVDLDASEDNPVYIVALLGGGSVPAEASDLSAGPDELPGDGKEPDPGDAPEAEMTPVYQYCDDPSSMEELHNAKIELIRERHSEQLGDWMDREECTASTVDSLSYEELLNVPGVDDPEAGFDEMPNGWTRKSLLQFWATVGGTWRSCNARMVRHFGPRMSKKFCSAAKDSLLKTERWRNRY